jgi:hypothetical protein
MTNQDVIGELIKAHLEIIKVAATGSITDPEVFEKWSLEVAKMHATVTLKALLYDEDKRIKEQSQAG